jgi:hypothetical protein
MNTIDYCNSMEKRLIAWKAKMNDLTSKAVSHGSKEEERFLRDSQDRSIPATEMSSRIEQMKNERAAEGTPQRENVANSSEEMRSRYVLRPRLSWTGLYGKEPWPREKKVWEKV